MAIGLFNVNALRIIFTLVLFSCPLCHALGNTPEQNYILKCSGCHDMDGSGSVAGGIPPLPGYLGAFVNDADGRLYLMHVPGIVASGLDDQQIAQLMNFLNQKWGDVQQGSPFTDAEVKQLRAMPMTDVVKLRRQIVQRFLREGIATGDYPWP
ncbi:c-type cytochrome [Yersinia mollaretii]|uniref:c-type cytochrome n=1 Tax=Yersinia mollaretii TaxID=33060 RepID=UPI00005F8271|nr:cytochrome c [Yersinia mollaretii]MDN0112235.1 cytochrome c [Yersinia mollaretii]CQD37220.1 Cytochrome c552 [Yersinia mollaretii]CQH28970.1 Cytochrome c552 [Yersinia mollaretii]